MRGLGGEKLQDMGFQLSPGKKQELEYKGKEMI